MKRCAPLWIPLFALSLLIPGNATGHEDEPHGGSVAESPDDGSTTSGAAADTPDTEHDHEDHMHSEDVEGGPEKAGDHLPGGGHPHDASPPVESSEAGHDHANAADHSDSAHAADTQTGDESHGRAADGHEHDHATDHAQPASTPGRLIAFLGKLHPVVIHFPIALIIFAVALELLGATGSGSRLHDAAYYCVLAGALSAVVAAALGWAAGHGAQFPQEVGSISVLWLHRWLGVSTAVLSVLTAAAGWWSRKRTGGRAGTVYRILLVMTALLVAVTGHFGASLVFGLNHFTL